MSETKTPAAGRPDTVLTHAGRHPRANHGFVNPPVIHASTVTFPDVDTMLSGAQPYVYGRRGTPTSAALEEALTELEGGAGTVLAPSGLAAISLACLSCLKAGDHLLIADNVYGPTRHLADGVLQRFGIEIGYFDPLDASSLAAGFRPATAAVLIEAPGSLTFEMLDIAAVVAAARQHDALVLMDNTWATALFYRPLDHGVDLSIQAGTKYIVGHSDVMIGSVTAGPRAWKALRQTHGDLGQHVGPDDVYLALRGLRTMSVRLERHQRNALRLAEWLAGRDDVARVLYPALPEDPGHELWKRQFTGASGLFAFELAPVAGAASERAVKAFLDSLRLFGLGYSWGGFESLALWARPQSMRTARPWQAPGELIRLHVGLEDAEDLIADLEAGFAAWRAAR